MWHIRGLSKVLIAEKPYVTIVLEDSSATTEVFYSVMIGISWKRFRHISISKYDCWVHRMYPVYFMMTIVTVAERVLHSQKTDYSPLSYVTIFFMIIGSSGIWKMCPTILEIIFGLDLLQNIAVERVEFVWKMPKCNTWHFERMFLAFCT